MKTAGLLLESLDVLILLGKLLLETGDFTNITSLSELLGLLGVLVGALVLLDALLQAKDLEDHNVGSVEDEREEECEAAEVHITLGVKLPGLHLHALVPHNLSTGGVEEVSHSVSQHSQLVRGRGEEKNVRSAVTLTGLSELDLDPVDSVDGVDKQDQNKNESDLETILKLCYNGILGDKAA